MINDENKKTARLICDCTPEQLEEVKKRAKEADLSMRQYIMQSIALRMEVDNKSKLRNRPQG
jgi:mobilization protein NikA